MNIYMRLADMYEWGVKLYLNGKPATPEMVYNQVLQKEAFCMPKISYDAEGKVSEISYGL